MFSQRPKAVKLLAVTACCFTLITVLTSISNAVAGSNDTSCTSTPAPSTEAAWTSSSAKNFGPGHWCMYNNALGLRVVFQSDGNLVAYTGAHSGGLPTWNSHTYATPGNQSAAGARLAFQTDGNVVVYNAVGRPLWSTGTWGHSTGAFYFSIEGGPNLTDNGGGAVASVHFNSEPLSRWYAGIQSPMLNDGSGQAIPTGPIPGWNEDFAEDFNTPATTATFANKYVDSWCGYADGTGGEYYNSSVINAHNGLMDFNLNGAQGGAGSFGTPDNCWNASYGRYSIRFRATGATGYGEAHMLWPANDVWGEGEEDWPEGHLQDSMNLYQHGTGCGNDCPVNVAQVHPGATYSQWHTATIEWLPSSLKFYLDNALIYSTTQDVPNTLHRDTLQLMPHSGSAPGHFYVAWVVHWSPYALGGVTPVR